MLRSWLFKQVKQEDLENCVAETLKEDCDKVKKVARMEEVFLSCAYRIQFCAYLRVDFVCCLVLSSGGWLWGYIPLLIVNLTISLALLRHGETVSKSFLGHCRNPSRALLSISMASSPIPLFTYLSVGANRRLERQATSCERWLTVSAVAQPELWSKYSRQSLSNLNLSRGGVWGHDDVVFLRVFPCLSTWLSHGNGLSSLKSKQWLLLRFQLRCCTSLVQASSWAAETTSRTHDFWFSPAQTCRGAVPQATSCKMARVLAVSRTRLASAREIEACEDAWGSRMVSRELH